VTSDPERGGDDLLERRPDGGGYETRTTVISRTVVRVVTPIILVTAVALLFQGHNLPGGGFIGAVLTVTGFVLVYVIFGIDYLQHELLGLPLDSSDRHRMVEGYRWLFGLGLALAAGSGMVPMLYDLPFLTQAVFFLEHVPLYGEFEVASAFAFDLGVFFTVVGGLLTIVGEVGYE
jgi:multicomponent Na+:H+ antiporter subunit B